MQSTQNMIHNNMQAISMQLKAQSVMLVTVQKHAILLFFFLNVPIAIITTLKQNAILLIFHQFGMVAVVFLQNIGKS